MVYLSVTASRLVWLLFLLLFGLVAAFLSLQSYRAMTSRNWPTTEGVVFAYYDAPNYRYTVGGLSRTSSVVSCNEFTGLTRRNGERNVARYPLNSTVKVHYHPGKPELAVLETDFDASAFKVIGVVLVVCLICLAGVYRGWRWRVGRRRI
jgi:hypothetical protein